VYFKVVVAVDVTPTVPTPVTLKILVVPIETSSLLKFSSK